MRRQKIIEYYFNEIEQYKKTNIKNSIPEKIIEIFDDAVLALEVASDDFKERNSEKLYEINDAIVYLESLKKNCMYGLDIFGLSEYYDEIKATNFRHGKKLRGKKTSLVKIKRFFHELYNKIRFRLIDCLGDDYGFGASGVQPVEKENEEVV